MIGETTWLRFRAHFPCQRLGIARRALTLGFIDQNEYGGFIAAFKARLADRKTMERFRFSPPERLGFSPALRRHW